MFLVDTNVVSELRRAKTGKVDANVLSWAESVSAVELYISTISILEIEIGVLRAERRDDKQGKALRKWFEGQVLTVFHERVIPIDIEVALRCADLHVPNPAADRDALIAASALVHGMSVVTRNVSDFSACGVSLINPWLGGA